MHPFPIITGIGMVLGYALLGAGWIVFKSEGALRDWAYARIPRLAIAVFVVLGLAFAVSVTFDAGAIAQSNLRARSWGLIFPILGIIALLGVCCRCATRRRDGVPVLLTMLFFVAAYLTLGVMFWPYMIPYTVTVANAASPDALAAVPVLLRDRGRCPSSSFIPSVSTGCFAASLTTGIRSGPITTADTGTVRSRPAASNHQGADGERRVEKRKRQQRMGKYSRDHQGYEHGRN